MISMKRGIAKGCSVMALICSVFPLFSYLLAALRIVLSPELQTGLAGANIFCALLGLGLSLACIKSRETRSVVNILSAVLSSFWILMIVGFTVLALVLSFAG